MKLRNSSFNSDTNWPSNRLADLQDSKVLSTKDFTQPNDDNSEFEQNRLDRATHSVYAIEFKVRQTGTSDTQSN